MSHVRIPLSRTPILTTSRPLRPRVAWPTSICGQMSNAEIDYLQHQGEQIFISASRSHLTTRGPIPKNQQIPPKKNFQDPPVGLATPLPPHFSPRPVDGVRRPPCRRSSRCPGGPWRAAPPWAPGSPAFPWRPGPGSSSLLFGGGRKARQARRRMRGVVSGGKSSAFFVLVGTPFLGERPKGNGRRCEWAKARLEIGNRPVGDAGRRTVDGGRRRVGGCVVGRRFEREEVLCSFLRHTNRQFLGGAIGVLLREIDGYPW